MRPSLVLACANATAATVLCAAHAKPPPAPPFSCWPRCRDTGPLAGGAHQGTVGQPMDAGAGANFSDGAGVTPLRHAEQRGDSATTALPHAAVRR